MTPKSYSYYEATAGSPPEFPVLEELLETEVCIVGGGFAGLNTALGLVERGQRDVVLLESKAIAFGASGRNGGFVFGGFSLGEKSLIKDLGLEKARKLRSGTLEGVELIRKRIQNYRISCDDVQEGVYWTNWFKDKTVLQERQALLHESFHQTQEWVDERVLREKIKTSRYHDALFEPEAFHFHPLKYAYGLAQTVASQGVKLFGHSPAISLTRVGNGWEIKTPSGQVKARHVVLACGGYLAKLRQDIDQSILPIATYVMVTEPLHSKMSDILDTNAAIYDTRFSFDYYRPLPDSRLLWGGRISILDRSSKAVERLLYKDLLKVFPQMDGVKIDYAWSGLMSYARHQMPQVGQIEPGLWVAQAFGGHGVAPTTFAGECVAAGIAEQDTRWQYFSNYGLVSAMKPAGFLGAQLSYWWANAQDTWKAYTEK